MGGSIVIVSNRVVAPSPSASVVMRRDSPSVPRAVVVCDSKVPSALVTVTVSVWPPLTSPTVSSSMTLSATPSPSRSSWVSFDRPSALVVVTESSRVEPSALRSVSVVVEDPSAPVTVCEVSVVSKVPSPLWSSCTVLLWPSAEVVVMVWPEVDPLA